MKAFVASCFVAVVLLATVVQWSAAFNDLFEDFVRYPNSKAKRDLDMEEFFRDGDIHQAEIRALDRQRRANHEELGEDFMRRRRRSLLEDEDDEEMLTCSTHAVAANKKRSIGLRKRSTAVSIIEWSLDDEFRCSDETVGRIIERTQSYTYMTDCIYGDSPITPNGKALHISCDPNDGNWATVDARIWEGSLLNLVEKNGKAYKSTISHEFGHSCGLYHCQQEPGTNPYVQIDETCIIDGVQQQFSSIVQLPYKACLDSKGCTMDPTSVMHYRSDAFARGACKTIISMDGVMIPDEVMNTNTDLYIQEVKKLIHDCGSCSTSGNPLETPVQIYGKGCSTLQYAPTSSPSVYDMAAGEKKKVPVNNGNAASITCQGTTLRVDYIEWRDLTHSPKCRRDGAAKIIGLGGGDLCVLSFTCEEGLKNHIPDLAMDGPGGVLYINMIGIPTGSMAVDVICEA